MNTISIDLYPRSTKQGCDDTIIIIRDKIYTVRNKMKSLRIMLSNQDKMDFKMLSDYQNLNDDLRRLKIFEAEFIWTRNML